MPEALHILVVEDEPGIADTIHYALASDGFEPRVTGGWTHAEGPDLLAHVWAGNVPGLVFRLERPRPGALVDFAFISEGSEQLVGYPPATIMATPPMTTGVEVPAVTKSATAPMAVTKAPPITSSPPATMPAMAPSMAAFTLSMSPLSWASTPLSPCTLLLRFTTIPWKLLESVMRLLLRLTITKRVSEESR